MIKYGLREAEMENKNEWRKKLSMDFDSGYPHIWGIS